MSEWFEVWGRWSFTIRPIQVERSTENSVWVNGRRKARVSDYSKVFQTRSEAVQYVRERLKNKISGYIKKLQEAEEDLRTFESKEGLNEDPSS